MTTHSIQIKLGHVDLSKLETDEDFHCEARRLLPDVLLQVGEATGEVAWNEMQKGLKGIPGFKLNSSSSDKRAFMREAGQNYRREANTTQRRELEEEIIRQLREQKKEYH
ncbi:MAG TPA: hypothetical protein VIH42_02715 [Thermoguttaceae bacterium]